MPRTTQTDQTTVRGLPILFFLISHIIQLTPQQQSALPRNSAGAEALAVAIRPKDASREKNVYTYTYVHAYVYTYTHINYTHREGLRHPICVNVYTYAYVHVYVYTYTYIYILYT